MKRVTIKDIAKIAGVSYATVSRALSDSPEISVQTRERIKEICIRENYRVNTLARSLINNRTNVLGLILPDISNTFYAEVAYSIETYAREQGYNVMLCNSKNDPIQAVERFNFLTDQQADGIILCTSSNPVRDQLSPFFTTVPTVLMGDSNADYQALQCNAVSLDNFAGGQMGMEYLIAQGHKKICYLGAHDRSTTHIPRLAGAVYAAEQANISLRVVENPTTFSSIETGHQLANEIFSESFDCTAIFAATDLLALGVLEAAEEAKIRIPQDLSLLGFDNCMFSQLPKIKLSTIDQHKPELGKTAVDLLLQLIDDRRANRPNYMQRILTPTLIARETCLPPRTAD